MATFNIVLSDDTTSVNLGDDTVAAAASAARAEAAVADAEAAAASVTLTTATDGSIFASRTLLANVVSPVNGQSAVVSEAGAHGVFVFSETDLSAQVAIDTTRGIYVAPSAASTGASGAWVRRTTGRWKTSWFLTTPAPFTTSAIFQKIEDLRPAGQDVKINVSGTYDLGDLRQGKPGWWSGTGYNTVIAHTGGSTVNTVGICTSGGTRWSHMRFTGLVTPDNANARFPLYVSARDSEADTPQDMADFEFDHLWFDNCDTGIRVSYGSHSTENFMRTPMRVHIHDCVFDDVLYQAIILEANDIHIERCYFKLSEKPVGGYRPQSRSLRILGCDRVTVTKCRFDVPSDYQVISTQLAGIDFAGVEPLSVAYRQGRNITVDGNWFYGGVVNIQESADVMRFTRNWMWNDPTRTDGKPPACIFLGSSSVPVYFGSVIIEDNHCVGFPDFFSLSQVAFNHVAINRNTVYGNLRTLGVFEALPINITITDGTFLQGTTTQVPAPVFVEIEGNNFFTNPSGCGAVVQFAGNVSGMHLRYSGNKGPERAVNYNHVIHSNPAGTTPKVSLSRDSEFVDWTSISSTTQAAVAGDNVSMPSGFYASLMATSKFRPEQVVGPFPPVFP